MDDLISLQGPVELLDGSLVAVDNRNGKFNITPLGSDQETV
jgi:hypothetical protein